MSEPNGKAIGSTTKVAAGGAGIGVGVGAAIAAILVHFVPSLADVALPVEILVTALVAVVAALVGGKVTPTDQSKDTHAAYVALEELQLQLSRLAVLQEEAARPSSGAHVAEAVDPVGEPPAEGSA